MNGIIHACSHPNDADISFRLTEDQIFLGIFNYIDHLFAKIKPKKLFFMAVDGVAPRAKMVTLTFLLGMNTVSSRVIYSFLFRINNVLDVSDLQRMLRTLNERPWQRVRNYHQNPRLIATASLQVITKGRMRERERRYY